MVMFCKADPISESSFSMLIFIDSNFFLWSTFNYYILSFLLYYWSNCTLNFCFCKFYEYGSSFFYFC